MLYTLENEKFKIIANNHGAELSSISSKEDGTEYLWNGNKNIGDITHQFCFR